MIQPPPLASNRILVDTSAYHALTDARDASHAMAGAISDRLIAERSHLFTTNFVLAETHALLLVRLGRATAIRVLQAVDDSSTTVLRVNTADERRAREILIQYDDKDFSLTDAASFAAMERSRITTAFTFDRHFAQFGLAVLKAGRM